MSPLVLSLISLLFINGECQGDVWYTPYYIGCFADILYATPTSKHDLEETAISYRPAEDSIIYECIRTCRMRGFLYAAARVEVCYCGNKYGSYGEVSEPTCIGEKCMGYHCGSEYANAVFRACTWGRFGDNCQNFCNCANTTWPCETLTGFCPPGGCLYGWVRDSCAIKDQCIEKFSCQHGGTCQLDRFRTGWECICPPIYGGLHCERVCAVGYYGEACEKVCRCRDGSCDITTGKCESGCHPDFYGEQCEIYNPCSEKKCLNGASCFVNEDTYGCACVQNYFGHHCEYDSRTPSADFKIEPAAARYRQMLLSGLKRKRKAMGKSRSYSYEYLGCFRDEDTDRDLDGDLWVDEDMGPGTCARHCLRKRFTFAGIQAGTDCRCGNAFAKHGIVPNGTCDIVCASQPLEKCGAEDMNSIYSVCPAGYYEPSCGAICNCLADRHCDMMTGVCPNQLCKRGWTGAACNEGIDIYEWQFYTNMLKRSLEVYGIFAAIWTIWVGYMWMNSRKTARINNFKKNCKKNFKNKTTRIKMKKQFTEVPV